MRLPARRGVRAVRLGEAGRAYVWLLPWLIGLGLFTIGPLVAAILLSFTSYDLISSPDPNGLANYKRLVEDELFWKALRNTFVFTVATAGIGVVGSLALALLLRRSTRVNALARALLYMPTMMPVIVVAIIWSLIFNPVFGMLNLALAEVSIQGPGWLTSPDWAMLSMIVVYFWWTVGGDRMIIFLAGLQQIPEHLYEAAKVDGAHDLRLFLHITLPVLSPVILLNVVLSLVYSLRIFVTPLVLTEGGPANSTLVMLLYIYNTAFQYGQFGYAAALSSVFLVVCLVLVYGLMRLSRRFVHYESAV